MVRTSILCLGLSIIVVAAGVAAPSGARAGNDEARLYPFSKGRKVGFVDRAGRVAIEPTFDGTVDDPERCTWFAEGLQPVEVGHEWKFIDRAGTVVIEDSFTHAMCFFEGLAAVRKNVTAADGTRQSRYGYVDPTGRFRIEPRFDNAGRFSEGRALVSLEYRWGYIDTEGKVVIPLAIEGGSNCAEFHEGLACAPGEGGKGFIDTSGAFSIPAIYKNIGRFSNGRAVAQGKDERLWGYLSPTGDWAIPPRYQKAWEFSEGLGRVELEGGDITFIDLAGKVQFKLEGPWWIEPFHEGLAKVEFRTGPHGAGTGFIDRTGKLAILPRFSDAKSFQGGLAAVVENGRPLLIDRSGAVVYGQPQRVLPSESVGGAELVDGGLLTRVTGYPGPFERIQSSGGLGASPFGKPIWGVMFENADGTPSIFGVWLLEGDTFLTDDLKERLEPQINGRAGGARRLSQARGLDGYSFSWGGPEGGTVQTVLPSPKGAYEILVMIFVDDESQLPPEGAGELIEHSAYGITEAIAVAVHRALF